MKNSWRRPKKRLVTEAGPAAILAELIRTKGPIPFDSFMSAALYSDPGGFYRRHVPGDGATYRTSPSLTPRFGEFVCRQLEVFWRRLGEPGEFVVAEAGAGNGDLALAAIEGATEQFKKTLKWVLVEPLANIAAFQREKLVAAAVPVERLKQLEGAGPFTGVILANEVLDNFPFRIFEVRGQGAVEIAVDLAGNEFVETEVPITDAKLGARAAAAAVLLEEGDRFEIALEQEEWISRMAVVLERGYVLAIDYGDLEPAIWTERPAGSAVTYAHGSLGVDLLVEPGSADITAHVNFSALQRAAAETGLSVGRLPTQREWLESLGLGEVLENLKRERRQAEAEGDHVRAMALLAECSRVESLRARGGLGDLRVFLAAKNAALDQPWAARS